MKWNGLFCKGWYYFFTNLFFPLSSGQGRKSVYLLAPSSESNPGEATEENGLRGWSAERR